MMTSISTRVKARQRRRGSTTEDTEGAENGRNERQPRMNADERGWGTGNGERPFDRLKVFDGGATDEHGWTQINGKRRRRETTKDTKTTKNERRTGSTEDAENTVNG